MANVRPTGLAVMCMVTDGKGNILVQDRSDPHWPGITLPGGHVEEREAFVDAIKREVWEETGLSILNPIICGLQQFHIEDGSRYVVIYFRADQWEGELRSSDEGRAMWVPREGLLKRRCVKHFADMLEIFENDALCELYESPDGNRLL